MVMMGRMFALWLIVGCGRLDFTNVDSVDATPPAGLDAPTLRWTLVQTVAQAQSPLTIASAGSEHLVVVGVQIAAGGTVNSVIDDAGSVYVAASAARGMDTDDGLEIWYAARAIAGATTITVDTTTTVVVTAAWEVAGIRSDDPLDIAVALDDQPATTTPIGPPIETSAAGDFVVSVAIVTNGVNAAIHTGNAFTNDHRTRGNGWAHLTDAAAPAGSYQAEWDQPTAGLYCANAAAFRVGPQ